MKKLLSFALIALLMISLMTGCTDSKEADSGVTNAETSKGDTTESDTAEGKVLKIASDVDVPAIDQALATDGLSFEVIGSFIEGLAEYNADGKLVPAMAESWDVSEDGLVYTFHLRDAEWDNGTPVTANDFVFAWRRFCDPAMATEYGYIYSISDIKNATAIMNGELPLEDLGAVAIDDKTLEVTLNSGCPFFLQLMTFNPFYPINEAFYNEVGADAYGLSADAVLANGAFKVTEWTEGYGLIVAKNENYYKADEVMIDGIEWLTFKDVQSATLEFEAGNVDVVKLSAELVDKYKDNGAFTNEPGGYVWYCAPNYTTKSDANAAINNANIRLALAKSFDKDYIVNELFNDGSVTANYIIPTGLAASPSGVDYRTEGGEYLTYDVAAAVEAWNMGLAELGTDTVEIELLFDDAESVKSMAEFIQSEWQTNLPGLTITLKTQPKKNRLQLMRDYDYDVALTRWGPDYADPQTYLDLFAGPLTEGENDMSNTAYYTVGQAYDALYKTIIAGGALASSDKVQERWETMLEMEEILLDDSNPGIWPIYQSGYSLLHNPAVSGIEAHAVGLPHVYKNVVISD